MDELSVKCLLYAEDQEILVPTLCKLQMVTKMNDSVKKRGIEGCALLTIVVADVPTTFAPRQGVYGMIRLMLKNSSINSPVVRIELNTSRFEGDALNH
ncbi:hypothetical protein EVAR_32282_1 [Eumeta japonica]|uniref:Uncharacterized protein n=1 Tax=Eumeta variegata TaxID=151549 RepID=A0A4C1WFM9_EUMVA|nr:hypothetical protein EVAR_32282_1 [Eumeta japonica]